MAETLIAEDLRSIEQRNQYDAAVKRLLANKEILARIMKGCVREYRECSIEEIMQCIDESPQVGEVPVHMDEENAGRIVGMSNDDTTLYEGTVRYDIRFRARLPKRKETLGLIINIEAQRKDHPGYPLVKRGIYYCSRMISSQYGTVFGESHYEKIQKVYSIWLCENPAQKRKNSIVQYEMEEKIRYGHSVEDQSNYDLMSVIMVYMGNDEEEQQEDIIRMLDILLSPKYNLAARKKILQEEYGLAMTRKMEGEVKEMCNLSLNIYEKGIEQGIEQGFKNGINSTVIRMLEEKIPLDLIIRITGLSEEEIKNIQLPSEA